MMLSFSSEMKLAKDARDLQSTGLADIRARYNSYYY